jgi:hypothetical protein
MKKLLGIVFLGLLISVNALAKTIKIKCLKPHNALEYSEFKIESRNKTIGLLTVLTDDWFENATPKPTKKITFTEYNLEFMNSDYAIGKRFFTSEGENRSATINIDLKKKQYQIYFTYEDGSEEFSPGLMKCKN